MNDSCTFLSFPHDLKSLIFEYLSLSDCCKLQLVCRNLYYSFVSNSRIWAKHLYATFLDPEINKDLDFGEYLFEERSLIPKEQIRFENIVSSRKFFAAYYGLKGRLQEFFQDFLAPAYSKELTNDILACLRSPNYPTPCLKKDVHFFPTNTMFQNFLTEVHFELLQGSNIFKDRKQFLIDTCIDKMRESVLRNPVDPQTLLTLRWYLLDNGDPIPREKTGSGSKLLLKKTISKTKTILKNGRIQTFKDNTLGAQISPRKQKSNYWKGGRPNVPQILKDVGMELEDEMDGLNLYGTSLDQENCPNQLEEFYKLIHKLIRNHCQIIFTFLKTISDHRQILSEYVRLWTEFILTTIELNKLFLPFSELVNSLYSVHCQGFPNFPEFSIWRLMVKLWICEVYTPLEKTFHESFLSVFEDLRIIQNCTPQTNIIQAGQCFTYQRFKQEMRFYCSGSYLFSQFDQFVGENRLNHEKEKAKSLLRQFYDAMCDLSYDEFTIFYSNCAPVGEETPKGILDLIVLKESQKLYRHCQDILIQEPDNFLNFLKCDFEISHNLFGEELACKLKEAQISLFKEFLETHFHSAVKEYDTSIQMMSLFNQNIEEQTDFIVFSHLVSFLQIPEEICHKICQDKNHTDGVTRVLFNKCPMFNNFMNFLKHLSETLENQYKACEDACKERYFRGFTLMDSKYDNFFVFGKNLTTSNLNSMMEEVNKPGGISTLSTDTSLDQVF